jgi:serine/threonine protein kinase
MSAMNLQNVPIAVVDIFAGDVDAAEVVVEVYGKRVAVSVFSGTSPQQHAVEDRLIGLLNLASTVDDDTEYDAAINDILDILEAAGKSVFSQQSPTSAPRQTGLDALHSVLYPEPPNFQLKTVDGVPNLLPIRPSEAYAVLGHPDCDADVDFDIDDALPQYSSKDVFIQEVIVRGGSLVSRVLVNEQDVMLCKAGEIGLFDERLRRELEALSKVEEARAHFVSEIRVPKLRGYVKHAELGCVIGLLREWIPSGLEPALHELDSTDIGSIPSERRQHWMAQIRQTVGRLHEIGLVWGDGKIDNVVVDGDDNAWLIDFGGGWTKDWVDRDLAGTVEGDRQAIRSIARYLRVEGDT